MWWAAYQLSLFLLTTTRGRPHKIVWERLDTHEGRALRCCLTRPPAEFSIKRYLWENIPALGVRKLDSNEGKDSRKCDWIFSSPITSRRLDADPHLQIETGR